MSRSSPEARARQALADMVDAGAIFSFHPATDSRGPSFTYELVAGGNRQRCRQLIAEAKVDPLVWAALLREIATRSAVAA